METKTLRLLDERVLSLCQSRGFWDRACSTPFKSSSWLMKRLGCASRSRSSSRSDSIFASSMSERGLVWESSDGHTSPTFAFPSTTCTCSTMTDCHGQKQSSTLEPLHKLRSNRDCVRVRTRALEWIGNIPRRCAATRNSPETVLRLSTIYPR